MGTRGDVSYIAGLPAVGSFCSACAEAVRVSYRKYCLSCGKAYMAFVVNEYPGMCRECWREEWVGKARRVARPLERAIKAKGTAPSEELKGG